MAAMSPDTNGLDALPVAFSASHRHYSNAAAPAASPGDTAFIVPTYGGFDYAWTTAASLLECATPERHVHVLLVDDASPDWSPAWYSKLIGKTDYPQATIAYARFARNAGLTRGMNYGLKSCLNGGFDYIGVVNSDIKAPVSLLRTLVGNCRDNPHLFVGPVTNAPGNTTSEAQGIRKHLPDYTLDDSSQAVDATAEALAKLNGTSLAGGQINGFFMFARHEAWLKAAYDPEAITVFPPLIEVMPSGRRNPTPAMTGQESWLARQCRLRGLRMAVATGAFCFHYRSVSRPGHETSGSFRSDLKSGF